MRTKALLLVVAFAVAGCKSAPKAAPAVAGAPQASKPVMMSTEARVEAAKVAESHPAFKLFRQKIDMPTILVVAEDTTDEQLKSLLWYVRIQVRNRSFHDLPLQPTARLYGISGYSSGVIDIYRGAKCAGEEYITSGPDPCGPSIHKAANYHWGDGGDPAADGASIGVTPVFDSTDNWQTEAEAAADPDGAQHRTKVTRIRYAIEETKKQSAFGSDIKFFVSDPPDEIDAVSYQFEDADRREHFLKEYLFMQQEHLCAAGFRTVKLAAPPKLGKTYPIGCK